MSILQYQYADEWPTWEDLERHQVSRFSCLKCEDTGQVWAPDPMWPEFRQCDVLVACACKTSQPQVVPQLV